MPDPIGKPRWGWKKRILLLIAAIVILPVAFYAVLVGYLLITPRAQDYARRTEFDSKASGAASASVDRHQATRCAMQTPGGRGSSTAWRGPSAG